ncbi:hypothetical protein PVAP13_2NG529403 [Panicum virgatum]|uniref:Uncharacterized protein n=1 Tax=Panicum virgatum TaxID=38727 RepID=A0A8T0VZ11_PANVG|nr:hypothetical protein PVAP13_2NG529403 [Panicum virgatum]
MLPPSRASLPGPGAPLPCFPPGELWAESELPAAEGRRRGGGGWSSGRAHRPPRSVGRRPPLPLPARRRSDARGGGCRRRLQEEGRRGRISRLGGDPAVARREARSGDGSGCAGLRRRAARGREGGVGHGDGGDVRERDDAWASCVSVCLCGELNK